MSSPDLILASTSRYRASLLTRLGLPFRTLAPAVDETAEPGADPARLAQRLAEAKARAGAAQAPGCIVIGSDQVACRDAVILGQPGDEATAIAQLMASSGRTVGFLTALCVIAADGSAHRYLDRTTVRFRELALDEVERYVGAEQPLDCAGAFKVEGLGISLFEAVETEDPTALIGLPLIALSRILRELGTPLP